MESVQVLVAAVEQETAVLPRKMHLQTGAIVCNQCRFGANSVKQSGADSVTWGDFSARGVGRNRNEALRRAEADIVLFADQDLTYADGYEKIVREAFERLPRADVIIFDLTYPEGGRKPIRQIRRLGILGCMRFGAARVGARLASLREKHITFSTDFGGGTKYGSGEDSLFFRDCLREGLRIYAYPAVIGHLRPEPSSWFTGYNEKYFFDKGVLWSQLFPHGGWAYGLAHCLKQRKRYADFGWLPAWRAVCRGLRQGKRGL